MWNLFYRQPRVLVLTIGLIVACGLAGLQLLPRLEDPRFTNRLGFIVTRWPGASAQRVEALVTVKLEEKLEDLGQIDKIASFSRPGVSVISVELADQVGPQQTNGIWGRVRDKLEAARAELPVEASVPDLNSDRFYAYTLIAGIVWQSPYTLAGPNHAILRRLGRQLELKLRQVDGTETAKLFGAAQEEILIETDQAHLARFGLTCRDLAHAVVRADAKVSSGQIHASASSLLIEVDTADDLPKLGRIPLLHDEAGRLVRLSDVGTLRKTVAEPARELALIDGMPAVAVAVRMSPDDRVDRWSAKVRQVISQFRRELGPGLSCPIIFDQSRYTHMRLSGLVRNFVMAIGAIMAVAWFMMGLKAALVVGCTLPLSSLMVVTGLWVMGIPIHQMSVTGLIIALGLLIDNAIVVVDQTHHQLKNGKTPAEATAATARHMAIPLTGSTLTTIIAFAPIALIPGKAGEFVGPIAVSVILAVASSLFLALTVVPALAGWCARWDPRGIEHHWWWNGGYHHPRLSALYGAALQRLLQRPALGIALGLALPLVGFGLWHRLPEQFFPAAQRDQFHVQLRLPAHAALARTRDVALQATEILKRHEQVTAVHWFLGRGAPMFYYNLYPGDDEAPYYAQALVQLSSPAGSTQLIRQIQRELDGALPQAQVLALQLELGPPFDAPIELHIHGSDLNRLQELGAEARRILANLPQVVHTRASIAYEPVVGIGLDRDQVQLAGLDATGVASFLEQNLTGTKGGLVLEQAERLTVRARLSGAERSSPAWLASLNLPAGTGQWAKAGVPGVPLGVVGQIELRSQLAQIERRDGQRTNTVRGYVEAGSLPGQIIALFQAELAKSGFHLEPGYHLAWSGESGQRDDAVGHLTATVPVLAMAMVATLVLALGSFRLSLVIGLVAVASIGLGLGMLWLFGHPFGFMAILGTMGLVGLAINDAIVVLAEIRGNPNALRGQTRAVRTVVHRSTRHILCTTATTAAGFTPLLVTGEALWPPLAAVMAGGVIGATFLALSLVPCVALVLGRGRVPFSRGRPSAA